MNTMKKLLVLVVIVSGSNMAFSQEGKPVPRQPIVHTDKAPEANLKSASPATNTRSELQEDESKNRLPPLFQDLGYCDKTAYDALKRRLELGADANAKTDFLSSKNINVLHHMARWTSYWHSCDPEIVKLLIEHKIDVNAIDDRGESPLHAWIEVAAHGFDVFPVIKLLVEAGARLDIKNKKGVTPLDAMVSAYINASDLEDEKLDAKANGTPQRLGNSYTWRLEANRRGLKEMLRYLQEVNARRNASLLK